MGRSTWLRTKAALLAGLLACCGAPDAVGQGVMAGGDKSRKAPRADEALAPSLSIDGAARYLDQVALEWTRMRNCGSCHTNYPYLMARPLLKVDQKATLGDQKTASRQALEEVRAFFEKRVTHWDDADKEAHPRWDAEVIATAQALAFNDSITTGKLHPLTRKALDRMWTLQEPDGGWEWLKCAWPPLEHDDYYGALVAALAVGQAPEGYARSASAAPGVEKLRSYFRKNTPPDLHHRTILLLASTRLDGLMEPADRDATIREIRKIQASDGGWCLPAFGSWKRRDGKPNDPAAPSDGYACGLAVYVLRKAGVPAEDPAIRRGVAWLKSHQRVSGRWFTRSLNNDKAHYITDVGTAYAVLALHECEEGPSIRSAKVADVAR